MTAAAPDSMHPGYHNVWKSVKAANLVLRILRISSERSSRRVSLLFGEVMTERLSVSPLDHRRIEKVSESRCGR